jgi:hypothetical protein
MISACDLQIHRTFVIENTLNKTAKIMVWIQMNFYPNPSGIRSQEAFLALRYFQKRD